MLRSRYLAILRTLTGTQGPLGLFSTLAEAAAATKAERSVPTIFDRSLKVRHKERSAFALSNGTKEPPFIQGVISHLLSRLDDTTRTFKRVLLLGNYPRHSLEMLARHKVGIEEVLFLDPSHTERSTAEDLSSAGLTVQRLEGDDEGLPLTPGSVDLVISVLSMHWINDLQGSLLQCRLALKPDGLFLGTMLGGTTLQELRTCLALAEQERKGGVSPRMSPLVQVSDAGQLLTDAGLKLTSVDVDNVIMKYRNAWDLIQHLRVMGESNACVQRQSILHLDTAMAMSALYDAKYSDEEGWIRASFQVVYMTGWSPDPSQQQPARRGSAEVSLEDLNTFDGEWKDVET